MTGPSAAPRLRLVQTKLVRRLRKHRKPLADHTIPLPPPAVVRQDLCWSFEQAMALKQRHPFTLRAPDEPTPVSLLSARTGKTAAPSPTRRTPGKTLHEFPQVTPQRLLWRDCMPISTIPSLR